ncbi:MAG: septal ring lytic transglycosylase RlpA family protein [Geminicoccaceae bacterium]|nr:septal ring lytic transglycosylase RlpA family protein [Geminicoccaceae bacterium]
MAGEIPVPVARHVESGSASWYGSEFEGQPTASGEIFDPSRLTAAHPVLPFGTIVTVTNLANGRKVRVRVNDRGPFVPRRIIDLSAAAARKLGYEKNGVTRVRIDAQARWRPRTR